MEVLDKDGLDYFWNKVKNYVDSNINNLKNMDVPVGTIVAYPGSIAPEGWELCNGSHLLVTAYPELFNIIGYTYGNTLGDDYFDLPNLKGRTIVAYDNGDTDFNTLGKTGGSKTHTLTNYELPKGVWISQEPDDGISILVNSGNNYGMNTQSNQMGQPMDIMNPYIVLNYIIKVKATEV